MNFWTKQSWKKYKWRKIEKVPIADGFSQFLNITVKINLYDKYAFKNNLLLNKILRN